MSESLDDARERVIRGRETTDGIVCPCCDQFVKVYKRRIKAMEAAWLCKLVRQYQREQRYYHIDEMRPFSRGDEAKLLHWGLIVDKLTEDTQKRRSGLWIPTEKGIDFVHGRTRVVKHLFLFNQEPLGFADPTDTVSIRDCLKVAFDYEKLMNGEL